MLLQLIPALGNRLICDVITLVVGWCFQTDPTRDVINLVVGWCFPTGLTRDVINLVVGWC